MSRSSFNPFISLWGGGGRGGGALRSSFQWPIKTSAAKQMWKVIFYLRSLVVSSLLFPPSTSAPLCWISTFSSRLISFSLFQTLRPQRMRPQNLRWKPKKGPGGTMIRLAGKDLQVFYLNSFFFPFFLSLCKFVVSRLRFSFLRSYFLAASLHYLKKIFCSSLSKMIFSQIYSSTTNISAKNTLV